MDKQSISVAKKYTRTPGPRYEVEGEFSGEGFRRMLAPLVGEAIRKDSKITVDLDGTAGYGTSFLEEVFGGLVRENGYAAHDLLRVLSIKSEEEEYLVAEIYEYIEEAQSRMDKSTVE